MHRKVAFEFIRFATVGVVNTLLCLAILWALRLFLGAPLWLASSLGYGLAAVNSYILNRRWTFKEGRHGQQAVQLPLFVLVNVVGALVYTGLVLLLDRAMPESWATVAALCVTTVLNFLLNKLVVFRPYSGGE